jgi:endonuclease/exonuclease/phosphatase family metal-dependent hydrolase
VAITIGAVEVQVINTHLGLVPREQRNQAAALRGPEWLGGSERRGPLILLGDLNAGRASATYRALAAGLTDARGAVNAGRATPSFPSWMPVLQIDHVLVGEGLVVRSVTTPTDPLSRRASDHLPLVADLDIGA